MFGQNGQLLRLGVGGLGGFDFGPGIAGSKAWIVAFVVLLVLAWLARWTMRPARRALAPSREMAHTKPISRSQHLSMAAMTGHEQSRQGRPDEQLHHHHHDQPAL